jgi:hypothetical protein
MFGRTLADMQDCIRERRFVMTLHAEEEMNDDELTVYDVEHAIMAGAIEERQRDQTTREPKYRVKGPALGGEPIELVVKFGASGKVVIITVYRTKER